jgi:tetratricopeptide (TPR) repeat protein
MQARGANPNVVRNIIYRDKGKLHDKRVLFEILRDLWATVSDEPLHAPEIEVLLSPHASAEQEVLQLLGREKRRAFRSFVRAVRDGDYPKLLVTGRPGSGKTMLTDYIQQALQVPPAIDARLIRLEFGSGDLGTSLIQLAEQLDLDIDTIETRLAKIASGGAYAVQADAQADVVRTILDALRGSARPVVLLLHVSQALAQQETLGSAPMRLNTPEVPRVTAPEWLWATLLEPLSRLADVSVLTSTTDLPARALQRPGGFGEPLKLIPPTAGEARRFVKARLPHLPAGEQEAIVQRAGRSFEELRTLTLLAEIRAPLPEEDASEASIARLSNLVVASGDARMRDFLAALATISLPEFSTFRLTDLTALRPVDQGEPSELERAFVDPVPGESDDAVRCFSRRLVRALRQRLSEDDPQRYRQLHTAAASRLEHSAQRTPGGEDAARYVHHLYEARNWTALIAWMRQHGVPPSLARRAWRTGRDELAPYDLDAFERLAEQVAAHYVKFGSHRHPDALDAFEALNRSTDARRRAWSVLKQAEGSVLRGRHEEARELLHDWAGSGDPVMAAEEALVRASIARWRGELEVAARIVEEDARSRLAELTSDDAAARLTRAKVAVWAGLIHKDRGDLDAAAREFASVDADDDLVRARLAFQSADVAMSLGRFAHAQERFDDAVELAQRSGALGSERTRYLARRGTLRLRLGNDAGAENDFAAARAILDGEEGDAVERGFWTARVDVECAGAALAWGRHDQAIALLDAAVARYRAYGEAHGVDAEYRIDRALLRTGVSFVARGLGVAWRPPLPQSAVSRPEERPDLAHGLRLLGRVAERVPEGTEAAQVPDVLARRALLTTSLLLPSTSARVALERAERLTHSRYARADWSAHAASLALREGEVAGARNALVEAWRALLGIDDVRNDPGLRAWLHALELRTRVASGDAAGSAAATHALLEDDLPDPRREDALRALGEALEQHGRNTWLDRPGMPDELRGTPGDELLRLGDRLVARWRVAAQRPTLLVRPQAWTLFRSIQTSTCSAPRKRSGARCAT